jgi:hypothetical protein
MGRTILGATLSFAALAAIFGAVVWAWTARDPAHASAGAQNANRAIVGGVGAVHANDSLDIRGPEQQPGLLDHVTLANREPNPAWRSADLFRSANRTFGFAYDLPPDVSVESGDARWADAGRGATVVRNTVHTVSRFDLAFSVKEQIGGSDPEDPFRHFAIQVAQMICVADSADGGTMCDTVRDVREMVTPSGLRVLEIRLVLTRFGYTKTDVRRLSERTLEPVYVVDVSRQGRLNALMIWTRVDDPRTPAQTELARQVALSVELTRECEIAEQDAGRAPNAPRSRER